MNGDLSFNGFLLKTSNIITNAINHTDAPEVELGLLVVANANRSAINDYDALPRKIDISGVISGTSQIDLDQRIDSFKTIFNGKNKNLDINYAGGIRRYIATKNSLSITRSGALKFAGFKVQFICTEPFGLDVAPTVLINQSAITTSTFTATPSFGGTAPYQLPKFTITINSLTGTGDYIQLSNNANNQSIIILGQSIANGNILIIDNEMREVLKNGSRIDYSGVFFEMDLGNASITYSDGFATRNVNIYAEYFKRYL